MQLSRTTIGNKLYRPHYKAQPRVKPSRVSIIDVSKTVGTSIIYFTFFYTTLNYIYYKSLNKDLKKFYSYKDSDSDESE